VAHLEGLAWNLKRDNHVSKEHGGAGFPSG